MDRKISRYLSEIGKKGGSVRSEAKARAARLNGAKHLFEEPKLIDPESVSQKAAKETYNKLKADRRTKVLETPYENAELVQSGHRFAILDHDKKTITYYMEYKDRDLNGVSAVYQNMVWRNTLMPEIAWVPAHVFFTYLLPIHGVITTDDLQTDAGKGFWRNVVGIALKQKLHVYYMDLNEKKKPVPVKSPDAFVSIAKFVYGHSENNKYRLVMISQKPFKTEVGMSLDDFGIPEDRYIPGLE